MVKTTVLTIFLLTVISLGFSNVYADEIISVSLDLQTILLDADEVIPLLNTNNIGNMSKVTVSATLPCNSSNVPSLKITGGILGNTTDIISTSGDYVNLRGPFDTCLFEDTIDISNATVPALNRIFLTNDGSSSVLTNLGTTITLTGIFVNQTPGLIPDFEDDFDTDDWTKVGTKVDVEPTTNERLDWEASIDGSQHSEVLDLGTTLSDTKFVMEFVLHIDTVTLGSDANTKRLWFGLGDSSSGSSQTSGQDFLGMYLQLGNSAEKIRITQRDNANIDDSAGTQVDVNLSAGLEKGIRLTRESATDFKIDVYSDSTFTGNPTSVSITTASTVDNLQYLKALTTTVSAAADSSLDGWIDSVKIWNGVTTVP